MQGDRLNVRADALRDARLRGSLVAGEPVRVVEESGVWRLVEVQTARGSKVMGWVHGDFLTEAGADPAPAPSPQPVIRLGVNVLNRHDEVALPLAKLGCRFFMVVDNFGFASRLKDLYPDAMVMVRRFWNRQMPSIDAAIERMDGCRDPRLIYTGLNEGDECGQGGIGERIDVGEIRKRAEFDIALARRIREISGATYAAGTFSMGTPEFNSRAVCDAVRAWYAPHYNSGLIWWDYHTYSPRIDHIYREDDLVWYETRWRFLFEKCGFDPASVSRVVSGETGEDEGGVGGFEQHGRSGADIGAWGRKFVEAQGKPLVVDGRTYASPFVGAAIYQVGNREDWRGYNVEGRLGDVIWN